MKLLNYTAKTITGDGNIPRLVLSTIEGTTLEQKRRIAKEMIEVVSVITEEIKKEDVSQ